jgi:hypothetical protein
VAAEYPTAPESKLADPSGQYRLSASANDRAATSLAQAVFGPPEQGSGGSRTSTSIDTQPDGSAVATAESVSEGLSFGGGVLKIAAVRSSSVTKLPAGAMKAATNRSLSVEGVTVAGQPVTIDAGGIHAGSGTAPVPFGSGAEQVSTALAQSGLSARVLRENDATGGGGEVLEVQSRHPLPFPGTPQGIFSWRIGKVTSALVRTGFLPAPQVDAGSGGSAAGSTAAVTTEPDPGPSQASIAAPAGSLGPVPAAARRTNRSGVLPAGYEPGPVAEVFTSGATTPEVPAAEPLPVAATPSAALAVPASVSRAVGLSRMRSLYGAVALGGLLIAGLAGLWWKKGVSWPAS